MAGTKEGGIKAAKENKKRHGEDFYARVGKLGGQKSNPNKGFGSNRELASKAGRRGGLKSRRKKSE